MFPRLLSPRSMAKEDDPFRAHVLTNQGVDGQKRGWSRVRRKRAPRPPFQRPAAPGAVEGSLSRLRDFDITTWVGVAWRMEARSKCYPGPDWWEWKAAYPGGVTLTSRPGLGLPCLPNGARLQQCAKPLATIGGGQKACLSRRRDFDITAQEVGVATSANGRPAGKCYPARHDFVGNGRARSLSRRRDF